VVHPTHDLDGNMTFDGREWRYVWNGENRLILASNATHVVSYVYDHRGRMVWKIVALANAPPDKEIKYTWDDYNIIAEHVTINETTGVTYNVWGLDLSGTLQGDGGVGGLLSVHKDGAIFFPSYDANGNVTEYVSSDGTLVSHRDYSVFGETTNLTGPLIDSFTFWWSTKPWCHLTALCEYEQRMYVQTTGRWISCDPEGDRNIINLYCFVRNSPLTLIDVLGLFMNDPICQKAKEKFKINGNDTGGGVVCDENGVKHVCVYYDGGSEQNPVAKKWVLDCTYVHENQHLVDLPPCKDQPCPQISEIDFSGTNNAQENLRQSECKAHYLHIRCLETARDVHCGGDQECIKEIEREMERVRSVMSNYWRCTDDGNPGPLYN
jgi:RHS repeat-associated protein